MSEGYTNGRRHILLQNTFIATSYATDLSFYFQNSKRQRTKATRQFMRSSTHHVPLNITHGLTSGLKWGVDWADQYASQPATVRGAS